MSSAAERARGQHAHARKGTGLRAEVRGIERWLDEMA
jgi:hypothetical protein